MTAIPTIHPAFVPVFALRAESKPEGGHTKESVQTEYSKRVVAKQKPNLLENRSLVELIGGALGITGLIAATVSYFKESTIGTWLSGIATAGGIGAIVTGFMKAVDFVKAVANNGSDTADTGNPPDAAGELGLPPINSLFRARPDTDYINELLDPNLTNDERKIKISQFLDNPSDPKNTNILMALVNSEMVNILYKSSIIANYLDDKDSLISLLDSCTYLALNAAHRLSRVYNESLLGENGKDIRNKINDLFNRTDLDVHDKYDISVALARLNDKRAIAPALKLLQEDPSDNCIWILKKLGGQDLLPELDRLSKTQTTNARVQQAYTEAIEAIKTRVET